MSKHSVNCIAIINHTLETITVIESERRDLQRRTLKAHFASRITIESNAQRIRMVRFTRRLLARSVLSRAWSHRILTLGLPERAQEFPNPREGKWAAESTMRICRLMDLAQSLIH